MGDMNDSDLDLATKGQTSSKDAPYEVSTYYNETYFEFQREMGEFGGWAERTKFSGYISPDDTVVDFGCGGGYLLNNVNCARKIGVEINDTARLFAQQIYGISVVKFIQDLEDAVADIVISNHALEHCSSPRLEIMHLLRKLKPGGRTVFCVPCESIRNHWFPGDPNNHLYTWNPMTFGNLFTSAGYEVESVEAIYHRWPPYYRKIAKLGDRFFNLSCYAYGMLGRNYSQVRLVARKPTARGPLENVTIPH